MAAIKLLTRSHHDNPTAVAGNERSVQHRGHRRVPDGGTASMNDNKQLRDEGVDWLYCALGTALYVALVLFTLWLLP